MNRLNGRLRGLERSAGNGSLVIILNVAFPDDSGKLVSERCSVHGKGWSVSQQEDEPESELQSRAKEMAAQHGCTGLWEWPAIKHTIGGA